MRKRIFLISLLLAFFSFAGRAENHLWTCAGEAQIEEANYAQARQSALKEAFCQALERSLEQILAPEVIEGNTQLINDQILSNPQEFVYRYRIISEAVEQDIYRVEAEVEVNVTRLKNRLIQSGLIITPKRTLILIVEEQINNEKPKTAWINDSQPSEAEKLLTIQLNRWGYKVVEPNPIFKPDELEKLASNQEKLKSLGEKYQSGFLLLGKLKISSTSLPLPAVEKKEERAEEVEEKTYQLKSFFSFQIIDLETAENKFFWQTQESAIGSDFANTKIRLIQRNIMLLSGELSLALEKLSHKAPAEVGEYKRQMLTVIGLSSWYQYQQLASGLEKIEQIRNVQLWGFAPSMVKFQIEFAGDRDELKKSITAYRFPQFRLLPIEPQTSELKFKIQPLL